MSLLSPHSPFAMAFWAFAKKRRGQPARFNTARSKMGRAEMGAKSPGVVNW
jgi:hypothetical protein